jgi:CBS domain-containing protein
VVFQLHLDTETVGHIDTAMPLCVDPKLSTREVLELLKRQNRGCVCLCEGDKLVGIFTERDALHLMAEGADVDVPIESVMTRQPATIQSSDTVEAAIAKMSLGGYRRLPVLDAEGRPVGLLKVSAILHYLVQHFPKFVYNLPPEPGQTTQDREGA